MWRSQPSPRAGRAARATHLASTGVLTDCPSGPGQRFLRLHTMLLPNPYHCQNKADEDPQNRVTQSCGSLSPGHVSHTHTGRTIPSPEAPGPGHRAPVSAGRAQHLGSDSPSPVVIALPPQGPAELQRPQAEGASPSRRASAEGAPPGHPCWRQAWGSETPVSASPLTLPIDLRKQASPCPAGRSPRATHASCRPSAPRGAFPAGEVTLGEPPPRWHCALPPSSTPEGHYRGHSCPRPAALKQDAALETGHLHRPCPALPGGAAPCTLGAAGRQWTPHAASSAVREKTWAG